jgi:hypothetical protein
VSAHTDPKTDRLKWYARRLANMSAPELAHRVVERTKQFADARRTWAWADFNFTGDVSALPGFSITRAIAALTPNVEDHARAIVAGDVDLLSARWPTPAQRDWWRGEMWSLDPASGLHWPGRGAPASKSAYRNASGFGDVKFVWELNRLQFLMPLAIAARRDNDTALATQIGDVIDGWMEANPPYEGVNWTNGIEFATRVVVALFVNTALGDLAPEPLQARLKQFIGAHVWMLARYPSLFSSANNHRVAELAALYLAYLCAPGLPRASKAHEARALEREVLKQFHDDGVGAEQSPTYAAYSLEWFLLAAMCAAESGEPFSDPYVGRLRAAALHLRWMMDAGGRTPAIGDDDEGRIVALGPTSDYLYPAAICATAARWMQDNDIAPPVQPATILDAFAGEFEPRVEEALGDRVFSSGGYSVSRRTSAHGVRYLAFDHAPLGFLSIAAHGHADALALWLHVGVDPVLIDAGTYLYHTHNGARDRFRGTAAHNTLCLDGRDQSQIAGPFNWSSHAKARLLGDWTGEHDGYVSAFGVKHVRRVRIGDVIEVSDALEGALTTPTPWSVGFTFHPDIKLTAVRDGVDAVTPAGARVSLRMIGAETVELVACEISTGFGRLAEAQRLIASGNTQDVGALLTTTISFG